jgi:ABC-2 type transport system permease protein
LRYSWTLAKIRMQLALRSPAFIFFSLIFPLGFLFLYAGIFARGNPAVLTFLMGPVLSLTVMGSFWGLSLQLVTFREQGILRRFQLTPVGAGALLSSSIIANYFLVLPTVLLEFLICRFLFHLQTFGNLEQVFVLVSVGAATFSAFGLTVASVTNNTQETQVINNVIWFIFLFFSGATAPLTILPGWLQHAALFLPATYLVAGLQGAMLQTASMTEFLGDTFALVVGMIVAFAISQQLFRWEPEAKVPSRAKAWVLAAMVPFFLLGMWENAYGHRLQEIRQNFQSLEKSSQTEQSR